MEGRSAPSLLAMKGLASRIKIEEVFHALIPFILTLRVTVLPLGYL